MLRFAPSPTGDMHIENLRVALFNHILSKQLNEDLIIRIEDIDKEKNIDGKDKEILELLGLFSIDFTQVLYQSENIKYHTQMAMQLLLDKKAFNCFCSDEALEQDKQKAKDEGKPYQYTDFCVNLSDEAKFECNAPFTVRIKRPEEHIKFNDSIKGDFDYAPLDVDSLIILKHDKVPTYNYACAVDDMLSNVSTVLREDKHLSDTPKQIHIRQSLGYDQKINYIHLPKIVNQDINKSITIKDLIEDGYLPAAIANYILLLGYDTPCEIFTIEEAIKWFDINKISKEPSEFDIEKLKFINKEHLKIMDDMRLSKLIGYADKDIGILAKIYLEECDTLNEIKEKISAIFSKKETLEGFEEELSKLQTCLNLAPFINDFDDLKKYIIKETSIEEEKILRFALTGATNGPNLSEIYPLIKNYLGEIV